MSIRELKPGESAVISNVQGTGPIRQRLLEMGIMPNVRIELERVSPVGDPIWIKFDGTHVSLRLREAESIVLRTH
jgi:ferrous iron transport protein A